MPSTLCPICNTTVFYDKHNTEFNHDCTESTITSLRQEDRISYDSPDWNWLGAENKVHATSAGIRGERVLPKNRRGLSASVVTSRDRLTHIDVNNRTFGSNPL